ncbi:MAG TPA: glycosyltransferase family 1 protein [Terracidiphilus sp.]|nr:glycosyltransferase family 1 protein [Terracidiphilus sp.]
MRIALFTETFVPKIDGIVTTLCETVRHLGILGHEVLVFAPEGGIPEFEGARIVGMKGHSFALYPELRLSLPRASMRGQLLDFQPDLLHVADPALLGIAALYYGGGANGGALHLPLVISYHTDLPAYLHYYHLGFLEPYIWRIMRLRHNRASLNLCTSLAMMEELGQHGIERLALWPGGVDTARFNPDRRSEAMRFRLSEGHPESPLLVYVGRLSPEKDIERLKPILEALPGTRLALIGDGPHREALRNHFAGKPVYLAGFLRGEELAAAYASSDVFVMPSRTETLGLVVLEAMSSGLPVVGARAGGIPEMIEDGVSGRLFDAEAEAVEALRSYLNCPEKRRAAGASARTQAAAHSWKAATEQLVAHYNAARAAQNARNNAPPGAVHAGMRFRASRLAKRTTLYAIRKLLP